MNDTTSARSILQSFGVGEMQATLAIQQIQLAPRSSDPDAGATVVIVEAVQRKLGLPVTGRIDGATRAKLSRICGPNWMSIPWIQITRDIASGKAGRAPQGVGSVPFTSQAGLLLIMGGVIYFAWKYKK